MKIHGYTRKKLNVISFALGVAVMAFAWLYTSSFAVVGRVNGMPVYAYQMKQYQKREYPQIKEHLINDVLYEQYNREGGEESFEEFKSQSSIINYGI